MALRDKIACGAIGRFRNAEDKSKGSGRGKKKNKNEKKNSPRLGVEPRSPALVPQRD